MKKFSIIIVFQVFFLTGLLAQHIYVHKTDGTITTFNINSIDSITFSSLDYILYEPFTGNILNNEIWNIYNTTFYIEEGLNMYVNDTLIIYRGPNNDNNGHYGIVSKNQYSSVSEASVDVWLSSLHNWQDSKVEFITPIARISYYNLGARWFVEYTNSAGVNQTIDFANNYVPDSKYSLKIRIVGGSLKFEWDTGSGFVEVYSTTDFSTDYICGYPDTYKRVMLSNSSKGYSKYDNLLLK